MNATFWAFIALILFIIILIVLKVPAFLTKILDERSARVQEDLLHARRLREEAVALLEQYKAKCVEAEQQAQQLIESAKLEVAQITQDAEKANKEYIAQRNKMVAEQIAQAEIKAKHELQQIIINTASKASEIILSKSLDADVKEQLLTDALKELKHFSGAKLKS